jgi:hypothetical protein
VASGSESQHGNLECGQAAARAVCAPQVVIDGQGYEVAVVVDYGQYMSLLGILATQLDPRSLPRYWRSAVVRCLVLDSAVDRVDGGSGFGPTRMRLPTSPGCEE